MFLLIWEEWFFTIDVDVHLIIILILSTGSKDLETEETDQVTLFKVFFYEMIFEYKYRCTFSGGFFSLVALLTSLSL